MQWHCAAGSCEATSRAALPSLLVTEDWWQMWRPAAVLGRATMKWQFSVFGEVRRGAAKHVLVGDTVGRWMVGADDHGGLFQPR